MIFSAILLPVLFFKYFIVIKKWTFSDLLMIGIKLLNLLVYSSADYKFLKSADETRFCVSSAGFILSKNRVRIEGLKNAVVLVRLTIRTGDDLLRRRLGTDRLSIRTAGAKRTA